MSIFDLPAGASTADPRWQRGYEDGENLRRPTSEDPVYVSGWCHGYCGMAQSDEREEIAAYHEERNKP